MKDSLKIKLSIVIASQNARESVFECLNQIERQSQNAALEIIVADNSTDDTLEIIKRGFPDIKIIRAPKEKLIPELWEIGIRESAGEYIALTTTHFIPAHNWIDEIIKAQKSSYSGIGGAIENAADGGLVSWAVYFCRYSRYMPPFAEETVEDFAADNASYKKIDLERIDYAMTKGFWEVFVHQEMRKNNLRLLLTPDIVVYHQNSFDFLAFIRQRFRHGAQFGKDRAEKISGLQRLAFILLSPLIPFVYLYRISRRVIIRKRNGGKFLISLPVLFLFLVSWAIGELSGYLRKADKRDFGKSRVH